jgi:hypothetical protein
MSELDDCISGKLRAQIEAEEATYNGDVARRLPLRSPNDPAVDRSPRPGEWTIAQVSR